MQNDRKSVNATAEFLKSRIGTPPTVGFCSGTGLDTAASFFDPAVSFDYREIPNFPQTTVTSHTGRMLYGQAHGQNIVAMEGRFHLYEGYRPQAVVFPVRVMQALGVETLILTNAAGGIDPALNTGDILVIADHINLTGENPLVGPNEDTWGLRFPPMTTAYDRELGRLAFKAGDALDVALKTGVYAGLKGPSLETPAEIRFLKTIGAAAVGFSTVQEVIAAVHGGMRVLGLSIITNMNDPDNPAPATLEEVLEVGGRVAPLLIDIVDGVIARLETAS